MGRKIRPSLQNQQCARNGRSPFAQVNVRLAVVIQAKWCPSDRTDVRFVRPDIRIYDARVVDLFQWDCARYLVGAKGQIQKQSAI
jgi:hypothetical protein